MKLRQLNWLSQWHSWDSEIGLFEYTAPHAQHFLKCSLYIWTAFLQNEIELEKVTVLFLLPYFLVPQNLWCVPLPTPWTFPLYFYIRLILSIIIFMMKKMKLGLCHKVLHWKAYIHWVFCLKIQEEKDIFLTVQLCVWTQSNKKKDVSLYGTILFLEFYFLFRAISTFSVRVCVCV